MAKISRIPSMTILPRSSRFRRWTRRLALGAAAIVAITVWLGHEFPGWFIGRKSSAELMADIFQAPVKITDGNLRAAMKGVNKQAVALFIRSCDLPDDVERRLTNLVESEQVDRVTVPFIYYLYEMYGAPLTEDDQDVKTIGYDEPAETAAAGGPDLAGPGAHRHSRAR
jgi:hypothetical protein